MPHTLIIGAGPAGLTTAFELGKLGIGATILEADDQVGGLSRTVNYRGYRFDIGGHRFFSKVPLINELWHEILGDGFLVRPRLSRIHYRNHYFDYPLRPLNALAGLGPIEALLVGLSYTRAKVFPERDETNFEQWVSNRFGYRLYNIFFKTYTEKVWGIPCKEIAADWAAQRIKNLSLSEVLRNALFNNNNRTKSGEIITTLIDQFHYPRYGPGMMWERCADLVAQRGCQTIPEVRVERIRHRHGRVECVYGRKPSGELVEFHGDHLVSTMPVRELINCLDPAPPDEVLRAANALRYRDYLTVVLMVKRENVFPDNWIYIHSPDVKLGRIQNYKNWSPYMVPDASRTSLGLEYFLWDHDPEWSWPQERLIELGIRDCVRIGLIDPSEVEDGTVVRMQKAYPVYDHAYQKHLATIRAYLGGIANLQLIGRNGQHRYNNQDHSMLTGVYAARNIAGAAYDVWSVNVEQEYHEEGVAREAAAAGRAVPTAVRPEPAVEPMSPDQVVEAAFARLDPVALGASVGAVAGVVLFLATASLLVQGGVLVGRNLSLLSYYFWGYSVTWQGALRGFVQAALGGFGLGYVVASLRNWGVSAYASLLRRRAEAEASRDLLDKV
jgi:protoporphyrinogen oxidase